MQQRQLSIRAVFVLVVLIGVQTGLGQQAGLRIDYTVALADTAKQQFHITTVIRNIDQPRLDLSLPTWTPGWYTVENYAKNILRFRITDGSGKILPFNMTRKQTWSVDTRGLKQIKIDYDYSATVLALNQAKIAPDYAFFTGIQLFLQPEGHANRPSTVRFDIPRGWKIATALKETPDPNVFSAADYDTLVDAPVELGRFDVTRFEVQGKPHYFVANPAGSFSKEKTDKFIDMLRRVTEVQSAIFGDLPYEKYVYFYFFSPPESNASGALEHLNSFVAFAPPGDVATPEMIIGTASHEIFHLWNVKRIRPAEMWPYDYSRENETPLLWVSEGFTTYYGGLATYRAGIISADAFRQRTADAVAGIENSEARNYISPANSSVSTWVGYDTPVSFAISYYTQGQNLAALLDLSIRHDSRGDYNLDDVMRALYNEHYAKGTGFTTADLIGIINRLTKKDYSEFHRRYIAGTDVPDYDKIFGYAGYRLTKTKEQEAYLGFNGRYRGGGLALNSVEPGSPAAAAGLRDGDIILTLNGTEAHQAQLGSLVNTNIDLEVERDGRPIKLRMKSGSRPVTRYKLVPAGTLTEQQRRVRDGWLKR